MRIVKAAPGSAPHSEKVGEVDWQPGAHPIHPLLMLSMITGSTGTSLVAFDGPVLTALILSTTSMPSTTLPNTA